MKTLEASWHWEARKNDGYYLADESCLSVGGIIAIDVNNPPEMFAEQRVIVACSGALLDTLKKIRACTEVGGSPLEIRRLADEAIFLVESKKEVWL